MIRIAILILAAGCIASAGETAAQRAFEQLKQLAGEWKGTNASGAAVTARYRLTGGGSTLVEEFVFDGKPKTEMMTAYYLDGDRIALTHYCMVGNQPRMAAQPREDGTFEFEFVGASNLGSPAAGHMHRAVLKLISGERMSAAWTFRQGGRDTHTEAIEYRRAK